MEKDLMYVKIWNEDIRHIGKIDAEIRDKVAELSILCVEVEKS